jgi:hypothetical protein
MAKHKLILGYTTDDDGVHVACDICPDFEMNLGFDATVGDAVKAQEQHDRDIADATARAIAEKQAAEEADSYNESILADYEMYRRDNGIETHR